MNELQERIAERKSSYYSDLAEQAVTSKDAFSELYDYFFPRVYNFIFAKVKNAAQADDIISVTFEKVFVKLPDYDKSKGAFSTWLFRIAMNEMTDFFRRQQRQKEATWEDFFDPADPHKTPEQEMLLAEGNEHLFVAMEQLSDRERRIVALKYLTGLSNKEIADLEDMTANNVGVVLHRSLDKLKKILEKNGYEM